MGDEKDISKVLLRDRYAIIEKKRDIRRQVSSLFRCLDRVLLQIIIVSY